MKRGNFASTREWNDYINMWEPVSESICLLCTGVWLPHFLSRMFDRRFCNTAQSLCERVCTFLDEILNLN